ARRLLAPHMSREEILAALGPESTLRRRHLIEAIDPPAGRPSALNTGFAVHTSLSRFLQRVAPACDDTLTANSSGGFSLSRRHASEIDRLGQLYVHGHSSPVVVLEGPDETVCRDAVRRLARNAGR